MTDESDVGVVERTTSAGVIERFGSLIDGAPSVFAKLSLPETPLAVVVLVPTLASDRIRWAGPVDLLTRSLLQSHAAVMSFDFPGEGLSRQMTERTLETLRRELRAVIDTARGLQLPIALLGIGVGGYVAGGIGFEGPTFRWGSPITGTDFALSLVQEKLINQMGFDPHSQSGLLQVVARDVLTDELEQDGFIDLSGFRFERSLYESFAGAPDLRSDLIAESFEFDLSVAEVSSVIHSKLRSV